jgi:phosphatidyl-myo-inositol dimannoside synthase
MQHVAGEGRRVRPSLPRISLRANRRSIHSHDRHRDATSSVEPRTIGKADSRCALVLLPSSGLGGGIEQYYAGLCEAWPVDFRREEMPRAEHGVARLGNFAFAVSVLRNARKNRRDITSVVCLHPNLISVAWLAGLVARTPRPPVVFYYGTDIWAARTSRRCLWRVIPHQPVTISAFSAGALLSAIRRSPAVILPTFTQGRLQVLQSHEAGNGNRTTESFQVLSVFRLSDARTKGAFRLIDACEHLRKSGRKIELSIAGSGVVSAELMHAISNRPWVRVFADLTEAELADRYRAAQIFVLATATSASDDASGEGFGIVLAEAAFAGLPVIGPAIGGSRDAMVDGWNGLTPTDESSEALAAELWRVAENEALRESMGRRSREWAEIQFGAEAHERVRCQLSGLLGRNLPNSSRS